MKKILLTLGLGLIYFAAYSQTDLTIYYMDNIPQRMYQNPAFKPTYKINIGLPVISSVHAGYLSNTITPDALFTIDNGTPILKLNQFQNDIKKNNYIGLDLNIDLLSFGFQIGENNYFSFNATENIFMRTNLPEGMLLLPLTGNAGFADHGGNLDFNNFGIDFNHYREYGFGWQRQWNDKLSVGARVKYLYGMENIHVKKNSYSLQTDPDTWDWTLSGSMDIRTSGLPIQVHSDGSGNITTGIEGEQIDITDTNGADISGYLFKRDNYGFGLDLGGDYKLSDKISVNASIVDLGFIKWAQYNDNFVTQEADFLYTGLDLTELIYAGSATEDSLQAILDKLQNDFTTQTQLKTNNDAYSTSLITRLHFGGQYQVYETEKTKGNAGALIQTEIYKGSIRPSVTLSYNQSVGRWLNASVSYSYANSSLKNLGAGLSLNLGPVQIYAVADNLLAFNMTKFSDNGESQFMFPKSAKYIHVHTGLNIAFGGKDKDRDKDGIKDKDDECPDTFGEEKFNGCPDVDKDGIPDKDDLCPEIPGTINGCPDNDGDSIINKNDTCPDIPGLAEFNGCPDTDEDGIMDKEDDCPDVAGLALYQGCPDTDSDSIPDKDDACPETPGIEKFGGCPDVDEDGLMDKEDDCPNQPGPIENKGCPWGDKDGDGILDNVDRCPEVFGVKENNGCPFGDVDNDGVLDKDDRCPNVAGVPENDGCPLIKKEEEDILKKAFENLEFQSGKEIIKNSSYPSLNELADVLKKRPEWKLRISGHTDNVGSATSNLRLSMKRSNAVKIFFIDRGINADRLRTEWFGETKPVANNNTPEGRQKNRRVEMTIEFE